MIEGGYGPSGGRDLPRVVTIAITRDAGDASRSTYGVRLHEEGTPVTWARDARLTAATKARLDADMAELDGWASSTRTSAATARSAANRLGRRLYSAFLGSAGAEYLAQHQPTALMIDADETVLDLPWELLADSQGPLSLRYPFGRVATTRTQPRPERDPSVEDQTIRILAVVDPTKEFSAVDAELSALRRLDEVGALQLDVLRGDDATRAALATAVAGTRYDILHLSCHGGFLPRTPGHSGLLLADGPLLTAQILELPFAAPPYMAFTSACWSSRAAAGRRLSSSAGGRRVSNGVAAAFLAAGASSCAGFTWPVTVRGASVYVAAFYAALVETRNVGAAVLDARRQTVDALWHELGDLAGLGFAFYGDSGSAVRARRDLARASPPDDDPQGFPAREDPQNDARRDLATAS